MGKKNATTFEEIRKKIVLKRQAILLKENQIYHLREEIKDLERERDEKLSGCKDTSEQYRG